MIQSPISEFIATLKDTGYTLRVEDGRLKVIHPSRPLTDEEREFIREHKPNIIQAVQDAPETEQDTPTDSPAPDDGLPFHDLHPNTREILLRHWRGWDAARRARFVEDVQHVMERTGYSEGNAAAFVLQSASPVVPGRPPAMTPEEKQALHARMWPTPPSSPQEPKSTVPGQDVDIGKIVSTWPKALRLKYSGLVGRYSNEMPLVEAMARAYAELQSTAKEN